MSGTIPRRAFLAGAAGAVSRSFGASEAQVIYIIATTPMPVPKRMAAEGVVFQRAYVASPDPGAWERSLVLGIFPHALSDDAAREYSSRGLKERRIELASAAAIERALDELDGAPGAAESVVVFTQRPLASNWDEQATHVPLAIRFPRRIRGGAEHAFLVSTVDVTPTLAALLGVRLPYATQGQDLSALLQSGHGVRPESIYVEGGLRRAGEWRMVVRGLDKLVVTPELKVLHLFNLGEDPDETRDLAQEPGHQLKIDEMRALVQLWMRQTGDGMDPSGLRRR